MITVSIPLGIVFLHLFIVPLQIFFGKLIVSDFSLFVEFSPSFANGFGQVLEGDLAVGFSVGAAFDIFRIADL